MTVLGNQSRWRSSDNSTPLTILHIAPTPFFSDRGAHLRIRGIIEGLNRRGLRNVLCTYHHGRDISGIETVRIPRIPGYDKEEAGPSSFKYLADLLLMWKSCALLARTRPDIIHGHLHEGALIGWVAKSAFLWRRFPLVFDVQGSLVGELDAHGYFGRYGVLKKLFWILEYCITRLPNYFICSSRSSMITLTEEFGVREDRTKVVNDGFSIVAPNPSMQELHRRLDVPARRPIVIYTGGLSRGKGLDTLCALILEARRRKFTCHFLVVGYPTETLNQFIAEHDLGDICTVTGRVPFEHLPDYLGLAALALEPKQIESGEASGKLLNYMGAGLPVVCFDTRNNREILGATGYMAAVGSVAGFVDQIEVALARPEEMSARGAEGRIRAKEHFSWDSAADKMIEIYRGLMADLERKMG